MLTIRSSRALAVALLLLGVATARAGDGLVQRGSQDDMPYNIGFDQKLGDKIPLELKFVDERENEVTLAQCVNGKPTILILAWYQCPGLCGEVLTGVMEAGRKMKLTCGKDFNIITVSIEIGRAHV